MPDPRGKRSMFSPAVFLQVRSLVAQGVSTVEIAKTIGCKLGTLRVKCSQNGISLRRRSGSASTQDYVPKRLRIVLPENVKRELQKQAVKMGVSEADLTVALLDAITRDNLYDAVLDSDVRSKKHKTSLAPRRSKSGSD
jgi:transposase-like protein